MKIQQKLTIAYILLAILATLLLTLGFLLIRIDISLSVKLLIVGAFCFSMSWISYFQVEKKIDL